MGFAEFSGPGLNQQQFKNFFLALVDYSFEVLVSIVHIHSIKSSHACSLKNLSKNCWVLMELEPGITDPKSGIFAPRPILEKTVNF